MKKYDLESVERLRIHELRDFAKSLHIPSPTTMKKEELIAKIRDAVSVNDGVSPNMVSEMSDEGEKTLLDILTIADIDLFSKAIFDRCNIETNDNYDFDDEQIIQDSSENSTKRTVYDENTPYVTQYDGGIFNFKVAQNEAVYYVDDKDIQGYVDVHPMGYGIIRQDMGYLPTDDDVFVPKCFMDQYEIIVGEMIRGKYKYSPKDKKKVLTEIISIDGTSDNTKKMRFEELIGGYPDKDLNTKKSDISIKQGERVYIDKMDIEQVFSFAKDIKSNNAVNVKVFINKSTDVQSKNSFKGIDYINIPFDMSEMDMVNTLEFLVERIKREFEIGKSNVLIIYKFSELIRNYSASVSGFYDYTKVSSLALNRIIKILSIAKSIAENVTSTVICIDKNGIASDLKLLFENELEPLFQTKLLNR